MFETVEALKREIGALLAAAVAAVALLLATAAPAAADHTYKLFHFNMCGNACHSGNDTVDHPGDPVEAIRRSLTSADIDPVAASLSEVCRNQFNKLMSVLPSSWNGRFVFTRRPSDTPNALCRQGGSDHDKGIAIVVHRAIVDEDTFTLPHPARPIPETRKLECVRADLFQDTRFCTVHISHLGAWDDPTPDANDHAMQDDQIAETTRHVNDYVEGGRPTVLMGDFNTEPPSNKLDRLYHDATFGGGARGRFKEVGQRDPNSVYPGDAPCRCGGLTFAFPGNLNRRIDFAFVSGRDFQVEGGFVTDPAFDANDRHSDHRIVRGQVQLIH